MHFSLCSHNNSLCISELYSSSLLITYILSPTPYFPSHILAPLLIMEQFSAPTSNTNTLHTSFSFSAITVLHSSAVILSTTP